MLLHTWPSDDTRRRYIQAIATASDRATKLTAQLLAFSRRQSLSPEVFDLCESVHALSDIITTVLGARIQVSLTLPGTPLPVLLDRTQLDTALINIAVNARCDRGTRRVTIEVEGNRGAFGALRRADEGDFAAISVTDTRHRPRRRRPHLRALLHHQERRRRNRPRPQPGVRLRQAVGRRGGRAARRAPVPASPCTALAQAREMTERPATLPGLQHGHGVCVLVVKTTSMWPNLPSAPARARLQRGTCAQCGRGPGGARTGCLPLRCSVQRRSDAWHERPGSGPYHAAACLGFQ